MIEGEYDTGMKKNIEPQQMNGGVSENLNVIPADSQLSLDESNPGFARDGFGRQSMSEKRHAQLDARSTGTYQRNKKAREERQQQSFGSEEKLEENLRSSPVTGPVTCRSEVVGPSLGLRKSSSLESLQTMIQELNKDDEALKRALQSGSSRSARGRGCNESFRAAVDRSYDAPATTVTMETLDEESESGSHILTRSVEDPFQDDLLSMYCRNSKSSKKKSLLKGLGSVFKFGKNRKQSQDLKGKDEDSAQDSDFSQQHQSTSSKDQDRLSDTSREGGRRQIPRDNTSGSSLDTVPNRQERMQSLREQYQRMHQRRQGQYPLEQKEEYYENELKEKEGNYAMPFEVIHGRSQSLDIHKEPSHGTSKVHPVGDPNRYSHYMNYKEIQQHINQRSHHGPSVKSPPKSDPLPNILPEIPHPGSFFDPTGLHPMKKHTTTSQSSDASSNSLPRGTHVTDYGLGHSQGKPYFIHDGHDHGNYGRMNVHHFYPNNNNKLYSHIVPGSKV
ncbi:partitioning defective 3 homolog [Caerostris extrusa]|uniref:Partitioning defective 3 homolog n=1 Tax=Caerostris extrusa TaxID=172846 RepID=A0AAV4NRD1_CAEEX|nr:partitioning defective 3 homolog [Caerostris extrusa]